MGCQAQAETETHEKEIKTQSPATEDKNAASNLIMYKSATPDSILRQFCRGPPNKVSVLEGNSSLLLDLSAAAFKSKRSVARSWGGKLCKDICEQPAVTVFLFCSQGLCQSFSGGTFRIRHFSNTLAPRAASSCQREETTLDSLPGGGQSESQVCGNCSHVVGCAFVFV